MIKYLVLCVGFIIGIPKAPVIKSTGHLPDIQLYDLHGKHTTLGTLGKGRVTFIDNWFIPCPPVF